MENDNITIKNKKKCNKRNKNLLFKQWASRYFLHFYGVSIYWCNNLYLKLTNNLITFKSILPFCCLMGINLPLLADLPQVEPVATTNIIQGSAPYLTFDGGQTQSWDTDRFLNIELPDGKVLTPKNNPSSIANPISLPRDGIKLSDIKTLIPSGQNAISMTDLLNNNGFWADKDGDGDITATGNLTITGRDANGTEMGLDDTFQDCYAPYSITMQSDYSILSTAYGEPKSTRIGANRATYYLNPPKGACTYSVKPNLYLSNSHKGNWSGSNYSGPPSEWDDAKGFKRQDLNNPASNFPTTGMNGLLFEMDMVDSLGSEMAFDKSPSTSGIDLNITGNGSIAKIRLVGPKDGDNATEAATAVPTTFILYSDSAKTNKVYSFTIQKWFIARKDYAGVSQYADAKQYCEQLGYQVPIVNQLTNANSRYWNQGLAGQGNNYQRRIGGGLLAEWGDMHDYQYPGSNMENYAVYWTQNTYQAERLYNLVVYAKDGSSGVRTYGRTVCVN
jgi:hypothetical protein